MKALSIRLTSLTRSHQSTFQPGAGLGGSQQESRPGQAALEGRCPGGNLMIKNGFLCLAGFPVLATEMPLPVGGWGRRWAVDAIPGGVKEKRPHEGGVGPGMLSPAGLRLHSIGIVGSHVKVLELQILHAGRKPA